MQVRFGLPAPLAQRAEARRLGIGAAVALGLHASLLLSAAWKPARALQLLEVLREEPLVQVDAPAEPKGQPAGGATPPSEPAPLAVHPRVVHRAPVHVPPPREVPVPRAAAAAATEAVPVAAATSTSTQSVPPTGPVPGNSRDAQRLALSGSNGRGLGEGNGAGGLFGNGRFVGDGPGALKARICFIPETTRSLKEIQSCSPIYEQFLDEINVPTRDFSAGFPGFEDRTEYFAVDINGTFSVNEGGSYRFRLKADDGAQLFIDNRLIVDNDGIHEAISKRGEVDLRAGRHRIRVWYFQGMKYQLALQLFVTPPGASERLFSSSM